MEIKYIKGGAKLKNSRLTCDEWHCITSKRFNQIRIDIDELQLALEQKDISQELFDLAIETSNSLKSNFLSDIKKIEEITKKCLNEVRRVL